jgi:hypothetical protein
MYEQLSRHTYPDAMHSRLAACLAFDRCTTRSRKILQFKHYCTDAPI